MGNDSPDRPKCLLGQILTYTDNDAALFDDFYLVLEEKPAELLCQQLLATIVQSEGTSPEMGLKVPVIPTELDRSSKNGKLVLRKSENDEWVTPEGRTCHLWDGTPKSYRSYSSVEGTLLQFAPWNYALYEKPDKELTLEVSCHVTGTFYERLYKLTKKETAEYKARTKQRQHAFLSQIASKIRRRGSSAR